MTARGQRVPPNSGCPRSATTPTSSSRHENSSPPRLPGRSSATWQHASAAHPEAAVPDRFTSIIDVHVILRRAGKILLLRRAGNVYASGQLCLPSGHLEEGENILEAGIRETKEETGIALDPATMRLALSIHQRNPAPRTPASGSRSNPVTGTASPSSASPLNAPSSCGPTPANCRQIRSSTPPPSSAPSSTAPPSPSTDGYTWSPEGAGIVRRQQPALSQGRQDDGDAVGGRLQVQDFGAAGPSACSWA